MIAKKNPFAAARHAARANAKLLAGFAGIAVGSVILGSAASFRHEPEPTYVAEEAGGELRDAAHSAPAAAADFARPAERSILLKPEPLFAAHRSAPPPGRAARQRALPVTLDRTVALGELDRFRAPFDGGRPPSAAIAAVSMSRAAAPRTSRAVIRGSRPGAGGAPFASSAHGAGLQGYSVGARPAAEAETAEGRDEEGPAAASEDGHAPEARASRAPARESREDDAEIEEEPPSASGEQQQAAPAGGDAIGPGGAPVSSGAPGLAAAGGSSQPALVAMGARTYGNGAFTRPGTPADPLPALPYNLESPPEAQTRALFPGGVDWTRAQANAIPGFSSAERLAACGLIAAEGLERYLYRDAKLDRVSEIRSIAKANGLWTLDGMKGPASEQRLLHLMGIETGLFWLGIDLRSSTLEEIGKRQDVQQLKQTMLNALAKGRPVIVSTLAHYYLVQGYSQGRFFVGHTGEIMSWRDPHAGAYMTLESILKDGYVANGLIIPSAARLTP
ncbi:MAG: hypothetical protein HY554_09865 [Elusimicrobia bacterium]|nr:hypothetical protein [Elusimicrobiota bacterium]